MVCVDYLSVIGEHRPLMARLFRIEVKTVILSWFWSSAVGVHLRSMCLFPNRQSRGFINFILLWQTSISLWTCKTCNGNNVYHCVEYAYGNGYVRIAILTLICQTRITSRFVFGEPNCQILTSGEISWKFFCFAALGIYWVDEGKKSRELGTAYL